MFDQIRDLISGSAPRVEQPPESTGLDEWVMSGRERWWGLTKPLPERFGPRLPHGRVFVAYEISRRTQANRPRTISRAT